MKLSGETEWLVAGKEDEALNIERLGPRPQTDALPDERTKETILLTLLLGRLKIKEMENEKVLICFTKHARTWSRFVE